MKTLDINGWKVTVLPEYNTKETEENLKILMQNQLYNFNTDWQQYKERSAWKKRRTS